MPRRRYGRFPISHFFRTDGAEKIRNKRFKVGVFRTAFTVRNVEDAPEGTDLLLEELIDHFIDAADRASGIKAEKCSIIIRSAILEKPIQIPYRVMAQNTAQVVMQQLDDVDQSGKRMGRPSLYSQPIHIDIVMGPSEAEAEELVRELRGGRGRPGRQIEDFVNIRNLIPTNNNDLGDLCKPHCLLLAVQLGIEYKRREKTNAANVFFQRLVKGQGQIDLRRRKQLIVDMLNGMRREGINYPLQERWYTIDEHVPMVQRYLEIRYPREYRLSVFGHAGRPSPIWKGPSRARQELCLFLKKGHYRAIRSLNAFFRAPYCIDCEGTYSSKKKHRASCQAKCPRCCGMDGLEFPCAKEGDYRRECLECNNIFRNRGCFQRHLTDGICQLYKRCLICGQIYNVEKLREERAAERRRIDEEDEEDADSDENVDGHVCGMRYCRQCRAKHHRDEPCFISPIVPKKQNDYLMIIYDFESEQLSPVEDSEEWRDRGLDDSLVPEDENYRLHVVNCVSAYLMCAACIQSGKWKEEQTRECQKCGENKLRMNTWTSAQGGNPLNAFLNWLFNELPGGCKRSRSTVAIAHYGGRYDMHLLLGELIRGFKIEPKITRAGNKLYEVSVERIAGTCPHLSFRDSFNWMSLKLEQLPKALGLDIDEGGKAFFPHAWNRNRNMDILLPHLPAHECYFPESMSKGRLAQFNQWYEENRNTPFMLREEIGPYCEQDCRVLAHAVVKFQQFFFEMATKSTKRDDVFANSLTLASACIRHFCINYLQEKEIAIIPDNGYHHDKPQSPIALKFMQWLAHKKGWHIQTRNSAQGEHIVRLENGRQFWLDGYVRRRQKASIAIEFLGCAWHGHHCLYKPHELCLNGKTALLNRDLLEEREQLLRNAGLRVHLVWECEVQERLKTDLEMAEFFAQQEEPIGPLFPRDAFQGGRTGPCALKIDLEEAGALGTHEISAYDVVSLYPAVNFQALYPIGHPHIFNVDDPVDWSKPEDLHPYKGLFKVFLLPPDDLLLPVVAEKINGKLIFHLCHRCAMEAPYGEAIKLDYAYSRQVGREKCTHTDLERGFVCTIAGVELELALSRGYRVTHLYQVYHWDEWSDQLLRAYVKDMMRIKIQASGWPMDISDAPEAEQEALKREFVERNQREYGIELDASKMQKNEGLRYVAKICLNSLWGRFGLRCNLAKDLLTSCPAELHTLLNDPKMEVGAIEMLAPDLFAVPYQRRREFVRPHNKYNIVVALITTANARCRLYEFMERIVQQPGWILLYTDTDSCFFLHIKGAPPPFMVGDMLGQMSREYADYVIVAYYSGGCKQYVLKLRHRITGEIRYVIKCRGLWERVDSPLDFNQFRSMVNRYGDEEMEPVELRRTHLQPNFRRGEVTTRSQSRRYAPIYDKGVVDSQFNCYPYGYRGDALPNPFE